MSQCPQRVLTDTVVIWDRHASGVPVTTFVRHGTVADITPGSALASAYGGPGNLSGVIPLSQRGNAACLSRAAVSNLWRRRQ
jgi:hypothetical protein